MAIPKIDKNECTGCEECVDNCPSEAISMDENIAVINAEACTECGECVEVCPAEAISEE
jgi:ferredoxin